MQVPGFTGEAYQRWPRGLAASIARLVREEGKGLILVIDKGNIVFGGTDITKNVTEKLK